MQMRTVYWMGKEEIASTKFTSLMKLQVNKLISALNKSMTHFLLFWHESTSVTNIMQINCFSTSNAYFPLQRQ